TSGWRSCLRSLTQKRPKSCGRCGPVRCWKESLRPRPEPSWPSGPRARPRRHLRGRQRVQGCDFADDQSRVGVVRAGLVGEILHSAGREEWAMAVGVTGASRFTYMDELLRDLSGIPPGRVRLKPTPGTATIRDLIRYQKKDGRVYELVDGTLVAKPVAFD